MIQLNLYVSLLLLVLLGCSREEADPQNKVGSGIVGRWRLFSVEGNTGASNYTNPIPAKPLQALTFSSQGRVSKEGSQLGDYFERPFYRIDSSQAIRQLRFLASVTDTIGYVVRLQIQGDTMHIIPSCFEGCRDNFVRIE